MTQSDIIIVFVMNKSVPMSVLIDESDIIIVFVTGCIYRYIMCTVCFRVVVALRNKKRGAVAARCAQRREVLSHRTCTVTRLVGQFYFLPFYRQLF